LESAATAFFLLPVHRCCLVGIPSRARFARRAVVAFLLPVVISTSGLRDGGGVGAAVASSARGRGTARGSPAEDPTGVHGISAALFR